MIDHIEIFVSDGAGSRAFYDQVLKPLGIEVKREVGARVKALGYGDDARGPFFWVTPIGTPCFLLSARCARYFFLGGGAPVPLLGPAQRLGRPQWFVRLPTATRF